MQKYFLKPGYIFLTPDPVMIMTVLGSSVAISLWDPVRKIGGMNHFIHPEIKGIETKPTALFAQPATVQLIRMFKENGVTPQELEANLFGGAFQENANNEWAKIGKANTESALELLEQNKIKLVGMDVGGNRGRKVLFNTSSGEVVVAKVNNIRNEDWYPQCEDN